MRELRQQQRQGLRPLSGHHMRQHARIGVRGELRRRAAALAAEALDDLLGPRFAQRRGQHAAQITEPGIAINADFIGETAHHLVAHIPR